MLARIDFDKNYNMEVPGEDSTKGWCNIIVGRYLFTFIGISIKFSNKTTVNRKGPCKVCTEPMVDPHNYEF